uniref:BSD domain-containing protein n=1 Tax=Grammatophora oceanica TaxID=210454 RepID=A0A7S1YGZ1_9STRA|mmetsp:Transcript_50300/g.75139  ORF Transcript_50300/g.75139 Transcript_50300/m.75139 type:complete len:847 (+) Transcript_50300:74-2614(+)|eukprot:CAMPEP_0194049726 /NCGR_PEP_ID=MMETSP0009_2-20130614/30857_1 /TAXON_ID=210454 /ORGANISM="Grammatophora oceanica, Strain CCMP 410" /LENGTH=846 /DNA_ID=CAMNT_0038695941 /DNA_START=72 /DNA_END=2612 /DNA_ORIENTATION=-
MLSAAKKQAALAEAASRRGKKTTYTEPLLNKKKSYTVEDEADIKAYISDFYKTIGERHQECTDLCLGHPKTVGYYYDALVPRKVSFEHFWQRFFYRCDPDRIMKEWERQGLVKKQRRDQRLQETMETAKKMWSSMDTVVSSAIATKQDAKVGHSVLEDNGSPLVSFADESSLKKQNGPIVAIDSPVTETSKDRALAISPTESSSVPTEPSAVLAKPGLLQPSDECEREAEAPHATETKRISDSKPIQPQSRREEMEVNSDDQSVTKETATGVSPTSVADNTVDKIAGVDGKKPVEPSHMNSSTFGKIPKPAATVELLDPGLDELLQLTPKTSQKTKRFSFYETDRTEPESPTKGFNKQESNSQMNSSMMEEDIRKEAARAEVSEKKGSKSKSSTGSKTKKEGKKSRSKKKKKSAETQETNCVTKDKATVGIPAPSMARAVSATTESIPKKITAKKEGLKGLPSQRPSHGDEVVAVTKDCAEPVSPSTPTISMTKSYDSEKKAMTIPPPVAPTTAAPSPEMEGRDPPMTPDQRAHQTEGSAGAVRKAPSPAQSHATSSSTIPPLDSTKKEAKSSTLLNKAAQEAMLEEAMKEIESGEVMEGDDQSIRDAALRDLSMPTLSVVEKGEVALPEIEKALRQDVELTGPKTVDKRELSFPLSDSGSPKDAEAKDQLALEVSSVELKELSMRRKEPLRAENEDYATRCKAETKSSKMGSYAIAAAVIVALLASCSGGHVAAKLNQDYLCAPVMGDLNETTVSGSPFWAPFAMKEIAHHMACSGRSRLNLSWNPSTNRGDAFTLLVQDEHGSVLLERKHLLSARVEADSIVTINKQQKEDVIVAPWTSSSTVK